MNHTFKRLVAGLTACLFTLTSFAQAVPSTQFTYDAASRPATTTQGNGQSHAFQYNAFNELALHKQPNPAGSGTLGHVSYRYNGQGATAAVTDPRGLTTQYDVNGLGETTTLTSPDTGLSNAQYDEAGNRIAYMDARGVNVTSTFDLGNRLTTVNYGDQTVSFGYDAGDGVGKLTSLDDNSGSTTWAYDKLGRVKSKTQVTGGASLAVAYTYLSGGRVETITYPSGAVVGFTYDGANVASITVNGAPAITGIAYLPFGAPKSWAMGGIGTYSRAVDTAGRVASYTTEFGTRTLTWDASYRLTGITETGQPARTYGYDGLDRLTTATEQQAKTFQLDLTGNSTGLTVAGASYNFSVDGRSNKLSGASGDSFSFAYGYDAAGNITTDGTRGFIYDGAGRLTALTGAGQYTYNGLGQRVLKATSSGVRRFMYAEDGVSLLGEYAEGGAVSETVYLAGTPVLVLKGGAAYFVLPDHLGTPRAVKSVAGSTVWRWNSDAFGNGAVQDNLSGLFQFEFNQRFPGQQFDAESGLHYNNARYYEPKTGRYITSDPIGLAGGLNTFLYAEGSPGLAIDPTGNNTLTLGIRVGATVGSTFLPGPGTVVGGVVGGALGGALYLAYKNGWALPAGSSTTATSATTTNNNCNGIPMVYLDNLAYPEVAAHVRDAIAAGHPDVVTVATRSESAKKDRRDAAMAFSGLPSRSDVDRDEWPMAMFTEGGAGASVRYVNSRQNRGAGSSIGKQCLPVPAGCKVQLVIR